MLSSVLLVAGSAFAAEKAPLQIREAVNVNGSPLAAGSYTVTWDGSGPKVELKIMKGKTVVATVPASLENLNEASSTGSLVVKNEASGRTLTQIRPNGKKFALNIGDDAATVADRSTK